MYSMYPKRKEGETISSGVIYKITCRATGKVYVGETVNLAHRIVTYRTNNCSAQVKLNRSIRKYGWDNHDLMIIRNIPPGSVENVMSELFKWEAYYIEQYESFEFGLNCTKGGGGTPGKIWKQSQRDKQIQRNKEHKWAKGFKHTPEFCQQRRQFMLGKQYGKGNKLTEEHKEVLRKRATGNNYALGYKFSTEHKMRISKPVHQIDANTNGIIRTWNSITEAERSLGINHVSECCRNIVSMAGGFIWRYADRNGLPYCGG